VHAPLSLATLAVSALCFLTPCAAVEPEADFLLPDLNPASARLGEMISPRQYGEWISVYYFGQES